MKIGITGQNGFIGYHLFQTLALHKSQYELIPFERDFFEKENQLNAFISQCDVIIHLAGVNRAPSEKEVFEGNLKLAESLVKGIESVNFKGHLIFASSTQELIGTIYGESKRAASQLIEVACNIVKATYTKMIIPNVFGPFGKPNYNSFIATFCSNIINSIPCNVVQDNIVELIYISELVEEVMTILKEEKEGVISIKPTNSKSVSEVLSLLNTFKSTYINNGIFPLLDNNFELQLFNTFRSYINPEDEFPKHIVEFKDARGEFSEIMRTLEPGQFSYSTTKKGITRGNHFHTRKVERFTVIKGEALIEMRKIGSKKIHTFELKGSTPSYVDMPIWYTHNIKNIGEEELITLFWINEPYNELDPDTYFENV